MNTSMKKKHLRKEMLKKRTLLSVQEVSKAEQTALPGILDFITLQRREREAASLRFDNSCHPFTVMSYMSYQKEFPTHRLNDKLLSAGIRLVLPYTDENFCIRPHVVFDLKDLQPSGLGIFEPRPLSSTVASPSEIDLILIPGVAFDKSGNRIGFGKGCYDRFLNASELHSVTVGLAYEFQICDSLPAEEADVPLQYLITEQRILSIARE